LSKKTFFRFGVKISHYGPCNAFKDQKSQFSGSCTFGLNFTNDSAIELIEASKDAEILVPWIKKIGYFRFRFLESSFTSRGDPMTFWEPVKNPEPFNPFPK